MAFHQRQTVAIDDVINDPRVSQRIRRIFDARSGIAAPLMIDDKAIGVVLTMSRQRQINFTRRDELLMEGLAQLTSLAVHTQQQQKQRVQTEYRFQTLVQNAPAAIFLLDEKLNILEANRSAEKLSGYNPATLLHMNLDDLSGPENDIDDWHGLLDRCLEEEQTQLETHFLNSGGHQVPVELHVNMLSLAGRSVYQVFAHDISKRYTAEQRLKEERERAVVTLESIADAVLTTDREGRFTGINPMAERLLEIDARLAQGKIARELVQIVHEGDRIPVSDIIGDALKGQSFNTSSDLLLIGNRGHERPVEVSASPIVSSDDSIQGAVVVIRDVGPTRKIAREMAYLAKHDTLTGLINRREFERRVSKAIEDARGEQIHHVICYLDLDRFKVVNDTCGHMAGDELLQQLSRVLGANIRASDTLARLGGDEFGLLLENCPLHKGQSLAEQICSAVREFRFIWQGKEFEIGVSIGMTGITAGSPDLPRILSTVDAACYAAKDAGRNQVQIYEPGDQPGRDSPMRTNWLQEIQEALEKNRFQLFRQEIRPLKDIHRPPHYEILLRMQSSRGDLISPDVFISTAERYQLMPQIDKWVINRALHLIAQRRTAGDNTHYNINLSGQSMGDASLLEFITDKSEQYDISPETICFEITETAAISDATHASHLMTNLSARGFKFALDDFGSGLSSFNYLKYLNVDFLKIDGNFVRDMEKDSVDISIVNSINNIAHAMGLQTVAEFAENDVIIEILRLAGIDYAQGYGIGDPEPFLDDTKEQG